MQMFIIYVNAINLTVTSSDLESNRITIDLHVIKNKTKQNVLFCLLNDCPYKIDECLNNNYSQLLT